MLNEKLKEAKDVLNNKKASQDEVNKVVKELEVALDNLKLVQNDDNTENGGSGSDSSGNGNDSNNLPNTGGTSSMAVGVIALLISGVGVVLRRKK